MKRRLLRSHSQAGLVAGVTGLMLVAGAALPARADVGVGDQAPLFQTLDENMQPVDMLDLTDGRPLVISVGSAS